MSTAFDDGYEAAKEAVMLEQNPYVLGEDEYDQWEDGWWAYFYEDDIFAEQDDQDD